MDCQVREAVTYVDRRQKRLTRLLIGAVEMVSGRQQLRRLYAQVISERKCGQDIGENIFGTFMHKLKVELVVDNDDALAEIPKSGPVLFIANHPYGAVDGIILGNVALRARPDTKIVTIDALCRAPEVRPHCLPVNLTGTASGNLQTVKARRTAVATLESGGSVAIFPAGGVAIARNPFNPVPLDLKWIDYTARLARVPGTTIVPVYFCGQNSWIYQLASRISGSMRASLICFETARLIGNQVEIRIGHPFRIEDLPPRLSRGEQVCELRRRTFALAPRSDIDWMAHAVAPG